MSNILASGQITLTNIIGTDISSINKQLGDLSTVNNAFWTSTEAINKYIYFGNQTDYVDKTQSIAAVRLSNNSFSICANSPDSSSAMDGNDIELARFGKDSLMLSDSYEMRYDTENGIYFKPLV